MQKVFYGGLMGGWGVEGFPNLAIEPPLVQVLYMYMVRHPKALHCTSTAHRFHLHPNLLRKSGKTLLPTRYCSSLEEGCWVVLRRCL